MKNEQRKTIWHKLVEHDLIKMLEEMHYDEKKIVKFQQGRFLKSALGLLLGVMLIAYHYLFVLGGVGIAVYLWWTSYKKLKSSYTFFLFKKQMAFAQFSRTLIPYLLLPNATLYSVLNKMLHRVEDEHMKACLERFVIEMNDQPHAEEPFVSFAKDAGGTDGAQLFMTTLYDYQQNSDDTSVINELGKMASEELFEGVDQIVAFKLGRFRMFSFRLLINVFFVIFGYMAAMYLYYFQQIFL